VLSSVVIGQGGLHDAFGGVVPEIAARAHAEKLDVAVARALRDAVRIEGSGVPSTKGTL